MTPENAENALLREDYDETGKREILAESSSDLELNTKGSGTKKMESSRRRYQRQDSSSCSSSKQQLSPSFHLGDRIDNSASANFFVEQERLLGVSATLFLSFFLVNGAVYTFNEMFLYSKHQTDNTGSDYPWNVKEDPLVDELENAIDEEISSSQTWPTSNSNPLSSLDEEDFMVYVGFVLWVTTILAGLGMELLVLLSFLKQGWSTDMEIRWRFAQFFFSLLAASTFGLAMHQDFLALLTLVPGLWKFGFPETIMYMTVALYYKSESASKLLRVVDFLNAVGTVLTVMAWSVRRPKMR